MLQQYCVLFSICFVVFAALNVTSLEEREPIIYHGYTLTSKLPFREVIHTIKVS